MATAQKAMALAAKEKRRTTPVTTGQDVTNCIVMIVRLPLAMTPGAARNLA